MYLHVCVCVCMYAEVKVSRSLPELSSGSSIFGALETRHLHYYKSTKRCLPLSIIY